MILGITPSTRVSALKTLFEMAEEVKLTLESRFEDMKPVDASCQLFDPALM